MGFIFGVLQRILKFVIYVAVVIAVILLIPNLPPYTKFTSIEIDATQPRTGALAPNNDLNNVEKLYIDKLLGPETFQLWNGELYTSLATGEIVKISHGGHVTFVTQIGQPCTGIVQEHLCGRPLGFVIDDKSKQMYVADAYLGIWRVDLRSYKKQLLVSPRVEIEGRKPMLFNSVAIASNGDLYWTDSTSDYNLKDGLYAIVSDPSGRFLRYNPAKNESSVLLDDLWFPNGIIVSPDNQFVLISESNHLRILKYYIDGPKKGTKEVFVTGLPGTPDTIRILPDGSGVIVALYAAFDDEHPLLSTSLASTPMARKFAARFMKLLELPFEFVNTHFPNTIFEQITYTIGHFATASGFGPGLSGIVQIDWNGNIIASYYNTDHSVYHISDAIVYNDKLYLGCPHMQNFIGSVPVPPLLKKAFYVAKPTPAPPKAPASEQKNTQKEKKPIAEKPKEKVDKPVEKKPTQKTTTEKSSSQGDKVKTVPPKQPEVKNAIPKETVKPVVKEEVPKSAPKVKETKPKQEAAPEPTKPKTGTTPKPATKTETTPEPNKISESKPKVASKVEAKKEAAQEQKVVPESKPTAVPKEEPKKEAPEKPKTVKSEKTEKPSTEKPASKVETPKATTPKQTKPEKKAKKQPIEDEPQIIVQRLSPEEKKARRPVDGEPQIIVKKVVPDEIPVNEEIPSDTIKPKGEPLKVIKKSGPIEIPTNV